MIDRSVLGEVVAKVEAEKGPFTLFALFRTRMWPETWDMIMAAPWVVEGRDAEDEMREAFQAAFGTKFPEGIYGNLHVVKPTDRYPPLKISLQEVLEETGTIRRPIEIRGHKLFGLKIDRAYIYRARPLKPTLDSGTSGAAAAPERVRVRPMRKLTPTATVIRAGCRVVTPASEQMTAEATEAPRMGTSQARASETRAAKAGSRVSRRA
jgi:hypothetical protein